MKLKDEFTPKFEKLSLEYDDKQDNAELWVKTRFIKKLALEQMPTLIRQSVDLEEALILRYQYETTIDYVQKLLEHKDIQAYKDLKEYFIKYGDNDKKYYNHFREEEKLIPENYLALLQDDKKKTIKYKLIRDIQNKLEIDSSTGAVKQSNKGKIYQMLDIINCDDLKALKLNLISQERIQKSQKKIALQKLQQNNKSNKSFGQLRIESFMSFLSTIIKWCREICRKVEKSFREMVQIRREDRDLPNH